MSETKSGLKTPFDQSTRFERKRLHLGVCGSVACYKAADLLRAWSGMGIHVSATLTPGALRGDEWIREIRAAATEAATDRSLR